MLAAFNVTQDADVSNKARKVPGGFGAAQHSTEELLVFLRGVNY